MESPVHATAGWIALTLNGIAVLMVAASALDALAQEVLMAVRRRATARQVHATFIGFGRWLVAALSLQLEADIVDTTMLWKGWTKGQLSPSRPSGRLSAGLQ